MDQLDNLPENPDISDSEAKENLLKVVIQQLENIQQNRIDQLTQDVERLEAQKVDLLQEIDQLKAQRQSLQEEQQQVLANLVPNLASQLQEQLIQRIPQIANTTTPTTNSAVPSITEHNDNAHSLITSLDSTLRTAFKTLQQDLNSYQSSLSQQLSRMHNLEQQGEAILETLIKRMSSQLQVVASNQDSLLTNGTGTQVLSETPPPQPTDQLKVNGTIKVVAETPVNEHSVKQQIPSKSSRLTRIPTPPTSQPHPDRTQPTAWKNSLGFIFLLLSTLALSVHHIIVGIIGNQSQLFNTVPWGGFLELVLGNSLLILWIRMLVVVPLLAVLSMIIYPSVWKDIRKFFISKSLRSIFNVLASGFFLFLSQALLYVAIAKVGASTSVAITFIYPVIAIPLGRVVFRDRVSKFRLGVIASLLIGLIFIANSNISQAGLGTALFSGIAFALYLIFMQLGFQKLHPVPVSLIQFITIFIFTSLSLMLPLPPDVAVQIRYDEWQGVLFSTILLGLLTVVSYLFTNLGIRFVGAATASIISSLVPVITGILAVLIIPGSQSFLGVGQIIGIIVITLGIAALNYERMRLNGHAATATNK